MRQLHLPQVLFCLRSRISLRTAAFHAETLRTSSIVLGITLDTFEVKARNEDDKLE